MGVPGSGDLEDRHLGMAVRPLAQRVLPEGAAHRPMARVLRRALRHGRVEQRLLPAPKTETFADWAARTPEDFDIAVKASRYLTHIRRLREPEEPVRALDGATRGSGNEMRTGTGAAPAETDGRLRRAGANPAGLPVGGPGSPSRSGTRRGSTPAVRAAARTPSNAAWCLSDTAGRHPPLWRTTEWGYVRFHRGRASPAPCYGRAALSTWAERLASLWAPDDDVYCYFNNDQRACAMRDAHVLALAAGRLGMP